MNRNCGPCCCSIASRTGKAFRPRSGKNGLPRTFFATMEKPFCERSPISGPRPPGAWVLDVGSGVGTFVMACRRRGFRAFGVEPDRIGQGGRISSIQIARRRLEQQVFAASVGECLPFADHSFDLVTMNQVMEHVSDQTAVLGEALRVLKDRGAIYIASPNYLRFYEPHYKIKWFPLLPKFAGEMVFEVAGARPGPAGSVDLHHKRPPQGVVAGDWAKNSGH